MVDLNSILRELPDRLMLVKVDCLQEAHVPPFPMDAPVIILDVDGASLSRVVDVLKTSYPLDHPVEVIQEGIKHPSTLESLESIADIDGFCNLYVHPLPAGSSFEAFQEVIAHLRAADGCPWDRKQTHNSLRPYLLEETYETLAALDLGDPVKVAQELGDLLLQIVLHAQIGMEEGTFRMPDVLYGIHEKIVRRHPHVFGDVEVGDETGVLINWERLKAEERETNGEGEKGMLDSVPLALPALTQAQEIQDRAARVGFDWQEIEPVRQKVFEELEEVSQAANQEELEKELGDLIFAVVNLVRWYDLDAESVLRTTNQRFRQRFSYLEKRSAETGRSLRDMTLDEMDSWWEEAKDLE